MSPGTGEFPPRNPGVLFVREGRTRLMTLFITVRVCFEITDSGIFHLGLSEFPRGLIQILSVLVSMLEFVCT